MKSKICLAAIICLDTLNLLAQNGFAAFSHQQNPFAAIGITDSTAVISGYENIPKGDSILVLYGWGYNRSMGEIVFVQDEAEEGSATKYFEGEQPYRWLSVDPVIHPYQSPYTGFDNNPVYKIDPDGRSGVAYLDKENGVVTIKSTLNFYGNAATAALAKTSARQIEQLWNDANGTVMINGTSYKVKFEISYNLTTDDEALALAINNTRVNDYEVNFVRVESLNGRTLESRTFPAYTAGGNSFLIWEEHLQEASTTGAHEYGHGLGFLAHEARLARIEGRPGIFATVQNLVDAEYTINPSAGNTTVTGTDPNGVPILYPKLNVDQRRVKQSDIDKLELNTLDFSTGKANVGGVNNVIVDKDGQKVN